MVGLTLNIANNARFWEGRSFQEELLGKRGNRLRGGRKGVAKSVSERLSFAKGLLSHCEQGKEKESLRRSRRAGSAGSVGGVKWLGKKAVLPVLISLRQK